VEVNQVVFLLLDLTVQSSQGSLQSLELVNMVLLLDLVVHLGVLFLAVFVLCWVEAFRQF
jgi:hypothetical protein